MGAGGGAWKTLQSSATAAAVDDPTSPTRTGWSIPVTDDVTLHVVWFLLRHMRFSTIGLCTAVGLPVCSSPLLLLMLMMMTIMMAKYNCASAVWRIGVFSYFSRSFVRVTSVTHKMLFRFRNDFRGLVHPRPSDFQERRHARNFSVPRKIFWARKRQSLKLRNCFFLYFLS